MANKLDEEAKKDMGEITEALSAKPSVTISKNKDGKEVKRSDKRLDAFAFAGMKLKINKVLYLGKGKRACVTAGTAWEDIDDLLKGKLSFKRADFQ
jgi:hypothetical protein